MDLKNCTYRRSPFCLIGSYPKKLHSEVLLPPRAPSHYQSQESKAVEVKGGKAIVMEQVAQLVISKMTAMTLGNNKRNKELNSLLIN